MEDSGDVDIAALLDGAAPFVSPQAPVVDERIPWLSDLVQCTACTCRQGALRVVPGCGPLSARVLILTQSPGEREDATGRPLVGKSSDELDEWLRLLDVPMASCWVTNTVKCRPQSDRKPSFNEASLCANRWLTKELQLLTELVLVLPLGDLAVREVLGPHAEKVSALRAYTREVELATIAGPPRRLVVAPLPHPAYILRMPAQRDRTHRMLTDLKRHFERTLPRIYQPC